MREGESEDEAGGPMQTDAREGRSGKGNQLTPNGKKELEVGHAAGGRPVMAKEVPSPDEGPAVSTEDASASGQTSLGMHSLSQALYRYTDLKGDTIAADLLEFS